jgi:hypothetical protein
VTMACAHMALGAPGPGQAWIPLHPPALIPSWERGLANERQRPGCLCAGIIFLEARLVRQLFLPDISEAHIGETLSFGWGLALTPLQPRLGEPCNPLCQWLDTWAGQKCCPTQGILCSGVLLSLTPQEYPQLLPLGSTQASTMADSGSPRAGCGPLRDQGQKGRVAHTPSGADQPRASGSGSGS